MKHCFLLIIFGCFITPFLYGQVDISGVVTSMNEPVPGTTIHLQNTSHQTVTDLHGVYVLKDIPYGNYTLIVFAMGKKSHSKELDLSFPHQRLSLDFEMQDISGDLENVVVEAQKNQTYGVRRLRAVEGSAIYEAKKNEVIELGAITANLATNNSRQVYAKVPGLNIYESDGAGLQLGIGARGLDPNRTSNFNVRQNGYDISADALGYPESYYTPATEAVDRIEVVRGAASLQYGTQFGGLLNFIMKEGPKDKKAAVTLRNSIGSYGFLNTFSSVGGTLGDWNYYSFFQYKRGNGWRENSQFKSKTAYTSISYSPSDRFKLTFQYTYMDYLAQQAGGLTDALYSQDPRQSIRSRNWFQVNWNLFGNLIDYKFSDRLRLNIRNFALIGGRNALGNLGRIDRIDDMQERNLFVDKFSNFGSESRLIYHYKLWGQPNVMLLGIRYYQGLTDRKQGLASDGSGPDFKFLHPDKLEDSDYLFPGKNFSLFAENVFNLTNKFSITPGARFEYISTAGSGYYNQHTLVPDPITGFATDSTFQVQEDRESNRSFAFLGLGLSYKLNEAHELYANYSQNFRSINFNDIRVNNPNLVVDENIQDESGFNVDVGVRGNKGIAFNYDVSFFYLRYSNRIGAILRTDPVNYRIYRYRANIADAFSTGLEAFGEVELLKLADWNERYKLNLFTNLSAINAQYISSDETVVQGNKVELVPPLSVRSGLSLGINQFKVTYQYSFVKEHFTDASNAILTPSAVEGIIPDYNVMDLSMSYAFHNFKVEASANNLLDHIYFTRRASGYPGPGIIPAEGRSFFLTVELNF